MCQLPLVITSPLSILFLFYHRLYLKCTARRLYVCNGIFDMIIINIMNDWSPSINGFIAPVKGIYYFSFSFGIPAAQKVWNQISNGSNLLCESTLYDVRDNLDFMSRSCVLSVTSGATFKAISQEHDNTNSSYYETSFRGFLYNSSVLGYSAAWSVHNSGSVVGTSVVSFPTILVSTGIT